MVPSAFRDRLTQHTYLSSDPANPLRHLEMTLEKLMASEDAFLKLEAAIKKGIIPRKLKVESKLEQALAAQVLTEDEVECLKQVEEARREALRVDDFSKEQLIRK
jgi:acyl-CoA dehydrogenase